MALRHTLIIKMTVHTKKMGWWEGTFSVLKLQILKLETHRSLVSEILN
jgi:hypothetical protein